MIAFDFDYYQPTTLKEATKLYEQKSSEGKEVIYYGGGTEFITFARKGKVHADTVIHIKGIPECNILEIKDDMLYIGSAIPLNEIINSNLFPLLGEVLKGIADHTSRNKITLGGNLNSQLMYKEAMLPLLLVDAELEIMSAFERKSIPLRKIFKEGIELKKGELLVQVRIPNKNLALPYVFIKRTKQSKIGYPVVSAAALIKDEGIHFSFSGVCSYPFHSKQIDKILNDQLLVTEVRVKKAMENLPAAIVDDVNGSMKYREYVMEQIIREILLELEAKR